MNSSNVYLKKCFVAYHRCILRSALCALLASGSACSAGDSNPFLSQEGAGSTIGARKELLHSVKVRGRTLDFLDFSAPGEVGAPLLAVEATLGVEEVDLIDALFEHYGPLTMLETFYAIAPPDLQPHELLVRSHSSETEALGRTNDALWEASLDPIDLELQDSQLVEKSLPANALQTCRNIILVNNATTTWTRTAVAVASAEHALQDSFLCAGGEAGLFIAPGSNDCGRSTSFFRQPLRVGMCHLDTSSPATAFEFGASFQGSRMTYGRPQILNSGQSRFTTFAASASLKRASVLFLSPEGRSAYVMATGVAEAP